MRKCNKCGKEMYDGFCVVGGFRNEYYCSKECLCKDYKWEEYLDMYDADEAYWTEWYDE